MFIANVAADNAYEGRDNQKTFLPKLLEQFSNSVIVTCYSLEYIAKSSILTNLVVSDGFLVFRINDLLLISLKHIH